MTSKPNSLWAALTGRLRAGEDSALISFPKSGRTWVRFMLASVGVETKYDHAGAETRDGRTFEQIRGRPAKWSKRRIVFLFRDPRDTAVSSYFQASKRLKEGRRFRGSLDEFIRDPRFGIEKIARFNLLWLESAPLFRDFMSVSYRGLQSDTQGELSRIVEFITGAQADESRVRRAVEDGAFDNMRRLELALGPAKDRRSRLGGGDTSDSESLKARRGKVGGWSDYFSAEDSAYADAVLERLEYFASVAALHDGK